MNSISQYSFKYTEEKLAVKPLMRWSKMVPMLNSAPTRIKVQNTFWDVEEALQIFSHDRRPSYSREFFSRCWGSVFQVGSNWGYFMLPSVQTIVLGQICSFAICDLFVPPDCKFRCKHDLHLSPRSENYCT